MACMWVWMYEHFLAAQFIVLTTALAVIRVHFCDDWKRNNIWTSCRSTSPPFRVIYRAHSSDSAPKTSAARLNKFDIVLCPYESLEFSVVVSKKVHRLVSATRSVDLIFDMCTREVYMHSFSDHRRVCAVYCITTAWIYDFICRIELQIVVHSYLF